MKLVHLVKDVDFLWSHSARSAWIETAEMRLDAGLGFRRTPQGVRGLKLNNISTIIHERTSHSARSAWIETEYASTSAREKMVALRKECVD